MSRLFAAGCVAGLVLAAHTGAPTTRPIRFVFTSDAHYCITRPAFRGTAKASAHLVNSALVAAIKSLPAARFPADGGLHSGALVGHTSGERIVGHTTLGLTACPGGAMIPLIPQIQAAVQKRIKHFAKKRRNKHHSGGVRG